MIWHKYHRLTTSLWNEHIEGFKLWFSSVRVPSPHTHSHIPVTLQMRESHWREAPASWSETPLKVHYELHPTHCHESSPFVVVVAVAVVSPSPFPFIFQNRQRDRQGDWPQCKEKKDKSKPKNNKNKALSVFLCLPETMFERHTKTQQQGFPVCLSVCLCASQKQYMPQRKTKPNKNIISGRKMLERRQNQEEQEHVCQTENVCKKKKNQKNHPEQEDICQKKKCLQEEKDKTKKKKTSAQKMFFARRKTKYQWQEAEHKFAKGGYSTVELYLYAADSELMKTNSLVSLLQLLETRRWRRLFFQGTIWRWVCSLSRYLLLSQFKKSLGCAAPRRILVTETEEKLAAYDPRLIYWRESRACM